MSKDVEFKVASKTARLIGRESISSAEGAIIELVKNSYDADATKCNVYINNAFTEVPKFLSSNQYDKIIINVENKDLFESLFQENSIANDYELISKLNKKDREYLTNIFASLNSIIIVDNGIGMTSEIIENHWMTIGTDSKENDLVSPGGRVHSGAKGIGRFALDLLGHECEMLTHREGHLACNWFVNWDDFDEQPTLNRVTAELSTGKIDLAKELDIRSQPVEASIFTDDLNNGTIIHIKRLREFWPKNKTKKLFENLKSLLPPKEENEFVISLFDSKSPQNFGRLDYSNYDEYDWKMEAIIKDGVVELSFQPNEYDMNEFDRKFFDTKEFNKNPLFTEADFFKGEYKNTVKLNQLIPGSKDLEDLETNLSELGSFTFTTYFMKRAQTSDDQKKYFYRNFNQSLRKKWFDQNGGVKIYRDFIRVRPYGIGGAFDWLKLDQRAAVSPAAPHRKGQWRVRSHQLAGIINISRISNSGIKDQANREGLIENNSLRVFQNLVVSLIKEFEFQRSYVASILDAMFRQNNIDARILEQSEEIIAGHSTSEQQGVSNPVVVEEKEKVDILVKRALIQSTQIEDLTEENKLLRVLASSGMMISSFAHDFKKMSNNLTSRHSDLTAILERHKLKLDNVSEAMNPFIMIEDMETQDKKLNAWLLLCLDTLKQDRRKSKKINLERYFEVLQRFWDGHLKSRNASLNIKVDENLTFRCFEIELDSIFNNLIANSYEAFRRPGFREERTINISVSQKSEQLVVDYNDTGPGLASDIRNSTDIFTPLYTTKIDLNGEPIGTGLGMTLVKGAIDDLKGNVDILCEPGEVGFKLRIEIPM